MHSLCSTRRQSRKLDGRPSVSERVPRCSCGDEAVKLSLSTAPGDPRVARAGTALHVTPRLLCGEGRGARGGGGGGSLRRFAV